MADEMTHVTVTCVHCEHDVVIKLTVAELNALQSGEGEIEDILPNHSLYDRDMFISATFKDCLDEAFGACEE